LALEAAYWAQLPANFAFRSRKAPITSRNLVGMSPFHNFPIGRATGNHWGDALTMLITNARSPFYFSLHASDPRAEDGGSRKDIGHTSVIGPTGSGKTVLIGFLVCMLTKAHTTQVLSSLLAVARLRRKMSAWVLICRKCKSAFQHSQISDVGMSSLDLPRKPDVPPTGNACVCPNCGHSAIYQRTDPLYRA